jgi:hypothetical protein
MNSRTFDEKYEQAKKAGEEANRSEPRAESARYDSRTKRIVVRLRNGKDFSFLPEWVPGLRGASAFDLANIEITPSGAGLHWERLDEDLSIPALLQGVFGPADVADSQLPMSTEVFDSLCAQIEIGWNSRRDVTLVDRLATEHAEYSADLYYFFALLVESELDSAESEENQQTSENTLAWLEKEGFAVVQNLVKDQQDETPNTTPVDSALSQTETLSTADGDNQQSDQPNNVLTFKNLARERIGFEEDEVNEKIAPSSVVDFIQKQPPGTYPKTREAIVQSGKSYGIDEEEGNESINVQAFRVAARRRTNQKKPSLTEIINKTPMSAEKRKFWLALAKEDENL